MRVCFLTHYFPPEVGAPQTRIDLLARTLAAGGAQVTVHTGFPHYPAGGIRPPYRNRPWRREQRDGIRVVRSAVYPAANRGFARRLADHAAFAISAMATAPASPPADVVIAESPPLFLAAAGVAYARIKRAACVVNVADLWPDSAVQLGALTDRRAIAAAAALERFVYARADLITAPTEGIVARLQARPEAGAKARRLWPVVDVERFDPAPRAPGPGPLNVVYAGTIGMAHGLEVLVEAARLAGPEVVRASIAGDGADAAHVRRLVRDRGVNNVTVPGQVPAAAVPDLLAGADAAAVLLRDLELFAGALPTKLLEAMAAGRAVVLAARGESAAVVRAADAGIVVAPEDPAGLAAAFRTLHADRGLTARLGAAGRRFAKASFGAERAAAAWARAISDAAARHDARLRAGD